MDWNINGNIFTTTAAQDDGFLWNMMSGVTVHATGAGGTGYQVGQILTPVGGTFTNAAPTFSVVEVNPDTGAVLTVKLRTLGDYTVLPSGAIRTTVDTGSGTGCRLRLPQTNYNTMAEKILKDFGLTEQRNWRARQAEIVDAARVNATNAQIKQMANVLNVVIP